MGIYGTSEAKVKDKIQKITKKTMGKTSDIIKKGYDSADNFIKDTDKMDKLLIKMQKRLRFIPKFGKYLAIIPNLILLLRNYFAGEYEEIPVGMVLAILGALIYLINPFDIIPDVILGFGQIDDASVFALCWMLVKNDVKDFNEWWECRNNFKC